MDPTIPRPGRRPRKVVLDRPAAEQLSALQHPAGRQRSDLSVLLAVMVAARRRMTRRLLGARRWDADEQRVDALLVIGAAAALVEQLLARRWYGVLDAMELGATSTEIAAAVGVDVDMLRGGLDEHLRQHRNVYPDDVRARLLASLVAEA